MSIAYPFFMLKEGSLIIIIIFGFTIQPIFGQGSMELGYGKVSDPTMARGQVLTAFYKINSQDRDLTPVGLGMKISDEKSNITYFDKENDILVKTEKGINTYTRYFSIPIDAELGNYKVDLSIWTGIPFESKIISNYVTDLTLVDGPREKQLLMENFEDYEVGKFPLGNWRLAWNGIGDQCQKVVDNIQHSENKSLRLWARPANATATPELRDAYSAVAVYPFSSQSQFIGYEFSVLLSEKKSTSEHDRMGFYNRPLIQDGAFWARVDFRHDQGTILSEDNGIIDTNWEPNKWIQVKVLLDRQTNTYDMWINGEKSTGHQTVRQDTQKIDTLALVADHTGLRLFFDDVRIFEYPDILLENMDQDFPSTFEVLKDKKVNQDNLPCKFEQIQTSTTQFDLGGILNDFFTKNPFVAWVIAILIGLLATWYFPRHRKGKT